MMSRTISYKKTPWIRLNRYVLLVGSIFIFCCIGYYLSDKFTVQLPTRKITIWTNDFHISPIHDLKHQLAYFNVNFIDKSLSGHCGLTNTCAKNLKILTPSNGLSPSVEIRQQFYEAYKDDAEMKLADAFACFYSVGLCELYMPFNKTIIIIAATRYEVGRHDKEAWTTLNKNLRTIASDPRNVVAANNLYDAEYIRYFTGIDVIVLPSLCDYTGASYAPDSRKPFLIAPIHAAKFLAYLTPVLNDSLQRSKSSATVGHLREVYKKNYQYSQIASHPGIIYFPYQASVMSLFEQYRMAIPLFSPSLDLLTEWHYKYRVVSERTWDGVSGYLKNRSVIPGVLDPIVPDPNNEFDPKAINYWLKFSDFYQWPHIIYFDSVDDLIIKLTTTDLKKVSQNMKTYNADVTKNLRKQWSQILRKIH